MRRQERVKEEGVVRRCLVRVEVEYGDGRWFAVVPVEGGEGEDE